MPSYWSLCLFKQSDDPSIEMLWLHIPHHAIHMASGLLVLNGQKHTQDASARTATAELLRRRQNQAGGVEAALPPHPVPPPPSEVEGVEAA